MHPVHENKCYLIFCFHFCRFVQTYNVTRITYYYYDYSSLDAHKSRVQLGSSGRRAWRFISRVRHTTSRLYRALFGAFSVHPTPSIAVVTTAYNKTISLARTKIIHGYKYTLPQRTRISNICICAQCFPTFWTSLHSVYDDLQSENSLDG